MDHVVAFLFCCDSYSNLWINRISQVLKHGVGFPPGLDSDNYLIYLPCFVRSWDMVLASHPAQILKWSHSFCAAHHQMENQMVPTGWHASSSSWTSPTYHTLCFWCLVRAFMPSGTPMGTDPSAWVPSRGQPSSVSSFRQTVPFKNCKMRKAVSTICLTLPLVQYRFMLLITLGNHSSIGSSLWHGFSELLFIHYIKVKFMLIEIKKSLAMIKSNSNKSLYH